MSGGTVRCGVCLRCCLVIFAIVSALFMSAPALSWRISKTFKLQEIKPSCSPCSCDCSPPLAFPGLANLTVTDCGRNDPEIKDEMEKELVDLLSEELKLQETIAKERTHHMNITLMEARRVASQYHRETEKCIAATETCEAAREWAEALLIKERKVTDTWERRARSLGWKELHLPALPF